MQDSEPKDACQQSTHTSKPVQHVRFARALGLPDGPSEMVAKAASQLMEAVYAKDVFAWSRLLV